MAAVLATAHQVPLIPPLHVRAFTPGPDTPLTMFWLIWGHLKASPDSLLLITQYALNRTGVGKAPSRLVIVEDSENGKVMGYAHWMLPEADAGNGQFTAAEKAQIKVDLGVDEAREKKRAELVAGLNDPLVEQTRLEDEKREKALGEDEKDGKCWELWAVGTDPSYQRRGVGKALLQWGTDQADRAGKKCLVTTTPDTGAYFMYLKAGFKVVGPVTRIDLEEYGEKGIFKSVNMVRDPKEVAL